MRSKQAIKKLREYAKARRRMQQDVEMTATTTMGCVSPLTPENREADLARG
jgi:hypothetical protein